MKHSWTLAENKAAYAGYVSGRSYESMARELGIGEKSMKMKYSNFKYILTGEGLSNYSKDSERAVREYRQ